MPLLTFSGSNIPEEQIEVKQIIFKLFFICFLAFLMNTLFEKFRLISTRGEHYYLTIIIFALLNSILYVPYRILTLFCPKYKELPPLDKQPAQVYTNCSNCKLLTSYIVNFNTYDSNMKYFS